MNQFILYGGFGQGVTGTIALQDQVNYYQTNLWNASGLTAAGFAAGSYGSNSFGGTRSPDIVGMLRVDQAWGMFQASVAAHNITRAITARRKPQVIPATSGAGPVSWP